MRFHTFKTSPQRNLLIADSQAKNLFFPNFNILSLPVAQIRHASNYIPQKGAYNTIVLFIGGNDLFYGDRLTVKEPIDVAEELGKLANELVLVAEEVFVIGITPRGESTKRSVATNSLIQSLSRNAKWRYRGTSHEVYSNVHHIDDDGVHLNNFGISGVKKILKNKILYENYSIATDSRGHPEHIKCAVTCKCGSFRQ